MVPLNLITITLLIISSLISIHLFAPTIQGRMVPNIANNNVSSTTRCPKITEVQKVVVVVRGKIMGSRPPQCEGRCGSCGGHCEAVQVPSVTNLEYARGGLSSDYKPITWKCKCSPLLFNNP
ncbi:EPIDERMAL PATTERNING FACTOR-like protein 2 [Silene latifolia]|uniref:EPIDERMAL PATTERNING FACTOR-like protein 2 n=1 Tax=Silene latifolia TaxID=37657 RepID=UPI003D7786D8